MVVRAEGEVVVGLGDTTADFLGVADDGSSRVADTDDDEDRGCWMVPDGARDLHANV